MQPFSVIFFFALIYLTSAWDERIIPANGTFAKRTSCNTISVTNGGPWGEWTWVDMCPRRSLAVGFSIKVLEDGGAFKDDSALNGIRLYCSSEQRNNTIYYIESESGEFGEWSRIRWCPQGSVLHAFQLKVEPYAIRLDNTAANNIKFRCSNGVTLEGPGGPFGDYGRWSPICPKGGICGIETKQQPYQGVFKDDTGLNDVRFPCCE
ncbi:vitelline membrane outer layer protein 1 homolog [Pogona vitticeps]